MGIAISQYLYVEITITYNLDVCDKSDFEYLLKDGEVQSQENKSYLIHKFEFFVRIMSCFAFKNITEISSIFCGKNMQTGAAEKEIC